MRLANGDAPNEGRVEIFYGGQWGTVCDNLWDLVDASVVCRALGFDNATEALGRAAFGQGRPRPLLPSSPARGEGGSRHLGHGRASHPLRLCSFPCLWHVIHGLSQGQASATAPLPGSDLPSPEGELSRKTRRTGAVTPKRE